MILLKIIVACILGQVTVVAPSTSTNLTIDVIFTTAGGTSSEQVVLTIVPKVFPIVEWMKALPPLRKIHYSWAIPADLFNLDSNKELLYEYVRLTHAVSITAQWAPNNFVDKCVQVCKQVNLTNPAIPASIALNYSPYHYAYKDGDSPIGLEDKYQSEIDRATLRFTLMRDLLVTANLVHNTNIQISAILLDSERFNYKDAADPQSSEWNNAITAKYQTIQDIVTGLFPAARVEWYGRGAYLRCSSETGWCLNNHHPSDFTSPGYSANVSLYEQEQHATEQANFRKTAEHAILFGVTVVNPWIALGAGYRPWDAETNEALRTWTMNWNYDLIYSWQIGAEIDNPWYGDRPERFAPWHMCEVAMFYPEPFGRTHDWGRHFIAYVRGAHNIKELP